MPLRPSAPPHDSAIGVTGLILAGGAGSRMGGADKGLLLLDGQPLAWHCLQRLQPQVQAVAINANRNLAHYRGWQQSVWPDADDHAGPIPHDGPLAGIATGLRRCHTPLLQAVACDTPFFPHDLVQRLRMALEAEAADLALPTTVDADTGVARAHPTFALLRTSLHASLAAFLAQGQRKLMLWMTTQRHVLVPMPDAPAFRNLNTPEDLAQAQQTGSSAGQAAQAT